MPCLFIKDYRIGSRVVQYRDLKWRNVATLVSNELFSLGHSLFIWRSLVPVVNDVREDLCLQHREECRHTLGICEVKGVITCHEIRHSGIDVLFWEGHHRHGFNGQYAVCFADNHDRAEECSRLKKGVGVFCRLTQTQREKQTWLG